MAIALGAKGTANTVLSSESRRLTQKIKTMIDWFGQKLADSERQRQLLQDKVSDLETQNALLRTQLALSQESEKKTYQQIANIMSQLMYRTKLYEDAPGLPEKAVSEEDMRPLMNKHSYVGALNMAKRESAEAIDRWQKQYKSRTEPKVQQISKSLSELAAETFKPVS